MKCANCGRTIDADTYRNIDGDPCCEACWLAEEDELNRGDK